MRYACSYQRERKLRGWYDHHQCTVRMESTKSFVHLLYTCRRKYSNLAESALSLILFQKNTESPDCEICVMSVLLWTHETFGQPTAWPPGHMDVFRCVSTWQCHVFRKKCSELGKTFADSLDSRIMSGVSLRPA